ncbi:MAG: hypothetical protein J6A68_04270 [Oscillospiraceae bacterium]|nr:hypothetical protein [Oscillospiraceae bacterium]
MKRCLAFLMALVFCVLLCSCSAGEHQELLDLLDEGRYSEAVDYINQLAKEEAQNGGSGGNNGGNGGNNGGSEEKSNAPHPLEKLPIGKWEAAYRESEDQVIRNAEFLENGKCILDGKEYLWEANSESNAYNESQFSVHILDGATKVYRAIFYKNKTGGNDLFYAFSHIYSLNEEGNTDKSMGTFIKPGDFEKIAITLENLFTYFEITEEFIKFNENKFGEATGVSVSQYLKLKQEYYDKLFTVDSRSEISVEFRYDSVYYKGNIDLENRTFSYGEKVSVREDQKVTKTTYMLEEKETVGKFFGQTIYHLLVSEASSLRYENLQPLRTTGELWFALDTENESA